MCYFYLLCVLWVCVQAGGLIIRENGESKTIEISSRKNEESGSNHFVSEKEKQEIIYKNSGNYNMQRRSNAYVPFNSLTLSEGSMPVHDVNTESESSPALLKMIQKTKPITKPSWQKTIALTSTTSASQSTLTPKHKSQHLPAFDSFQANHIFSRNDGNTKNSLSSNFSFPSTPTPVSDYSNRPLETIHTKDQMENIKPSKHQEKLRKPKIKTGLPLKSSSMNLISKFFFQPSLHTTATTEKSKEDQVKWTPEKTPQYNKVEGL
jgi:hypothetical protein